MRFLLKCIAILTAIAMLSITFVGCGSTERSSEAVSAEASETSTDTAGLADSEPFLEPETTDMPEDADNPEEVSAQEAQSTDNGAPFADVEYALPLCDETSEISLWTFMLPPITDYIAGDYSQNISYAYIESLTNVHVNVTTCSLLQATETLSLAVAAEDLCDITVGLMNFYNGNIDSVYEAGLLVNLMDHQEQMPNFFGLLANDETLYRDVVNDDGVISYCYQFDEEVPGNINMVIRTDMLDAVHMELPETYDEMHDVLTAFKSELSVEYPLWLSYTGGTPTSYLGNGFGILNADEFFLAKDGVAVFSPLESGFYDYLSLIHAWYEEGLISPDFINGTSNTRPDDNATADYGVYETGKNGYTVIYDLDENAEIAPIPDMVQNKGDTLHITGTTGTRVNGAGAAIYADAKDVDLCCAYLDFFYSEVGTYAAFFGEESVTYERTDDGKINYTEIITDHPSLPLSQSVLIYCEQQSAGIMLKEMTEILYGSTITEWIEISQSKFDENIWDYPSRASFTTKESVAYYASYTDISTYVQEYVLKFITGAASLETDYDAFLQALEDMGIQECIEIRQAALDRYYAKGK